MPQPAVWCRAGDNQVVDGAEVAGLKPDDRGCHVVTEFWDRRPGQEAGEQGSAISVLQHHTAPAGRIRGGGQWLHGGLGHVPRLWPQGDMSCPPARHPGRNGRHLPDPVMSTWCREALRPVLLSGPFITGSEVAENGDYPVKDSRFPGVPDGLGQGGYRVFAAAMMLTMIRPYSRRSGSGTGGAGNRASCTAGACGFVTALRRPLVRFAGCAGTGCAVQSRHIYAATGRRQNGTYLRE